MLKDRIEHKEYQFLKNIKTQCGAPNAAQYLHGLTAKPLFLQQKFYKDYSQNASCQANRQAIEISPKVFPNVFAAQEGISAGVNRIFKAKIAEH